MKARLLYFASTLALGLGWLGDSLGMSDGSGF
jgi:hypothetical protein